MAKKTFSVNLQLFNNSHYGKRGFKIISCSILYLAVVFGPCSRSRYVRQLVDGHPMYSAELVKYAEKGDTAAQCDLGECYAKGFGIKTDYTEATSWFLKSAEQGSARGQYNLGACYYKGEGVEQDYEKAEYWIRKSAEQGNKNAIMGLQIFNK